MKESAMNLRQKLENSLHDAMRNRDDIARDTIRMVFSSIKLAEVESRNTLDDPAIITILQKEVKVRKETISDLKGTDRNDLVDKALTEIKTLEKFLPDQLSDEEIFVLARKVVNELSATGPSDMGKVMKTLLPLIQGQAAPDRVSQIVKQILSGLS